jgi:NACHT domain-containing protein
MIQRLNHSKDGLPKNNSEKKQQSSIFIDHFLKEKKWYIVIGAPFGIGKTSLSVKLTSDFATRYLIDPNSKNNYIPIFLPLKSKLKIVDEDQNSLDDLLRLIAPGEEAKKRKILLICDGLDEYGDSRTELKNILETKRKDYPNIKVIITTRLEAGVPKDLLISTYIRLLPFTEEQVNEFFL